MFAVEMVNIADSQKIRTSDPEASNIL
jgi:hypothetical protein